jgi:hypothetical protein
MNGLSTILQQTTTERVIRGFYAVSLGLAMPLAVFTCNGWLGLVAHGIALTGAASVLEKTMRGSADCKGGAQ